MHPPHDYLKSYELNPGKKFWNLFHLQPMRDQKVLFLDNPRLQFITHHLSMFCILKLQEIEKKKGEIITYATSV